MKTNRIVCLLLCVLMLASACLPVGAFADDGYFDDFVLEDEPYVDEGLFVEDEPYVEEYYDEPITEDFDEGYSDEPEEAIFEESFTEDQPEELVFDDVVDNQTNTDALAEETLEELIVEDTAAFDTTPTVEITNQPVDTTAAAGSEFTMSVTANSTNVNYEWQYYYQGKWNSFQNSNSATLTKTANKAWNGWKIRVIVSDKNNANTKVTSDEVTLTIGAALTITNQPVDTTVAAGSEFTMSVTASSTNVNYDWQYFYQGKWNSFQNTNSATLTKTAKSAWNGWKIRVIVSDKNNANTKVASDEVTLTVISNIVIDDVTYKKLADGTYEVVSYSGSASSLTIPAKVENADVTKIGEEAFLNKTSLTSISLPNSITVIGARAFKGCTNLGQMTTHD